FCSEKETALYALLMGFEVSFNECPNIVNSYRADVREMINDYESQHHGAKQGIIESFIKELPKLRKRYEGTGPAICMKCGEPSSDRICGACALVAKL
ncbi:MAG: TIGR00269 family protein, partial [Candidatus Woesearchaeota archaeon]